MEISTGIILLFVGCLGCIGCIAGLIICRAGWARQRDALLKRIEDEDR